jgi:hypothetical protein
MITKHSALSVDLWESGNYTSFPVLDIGYHSTWGLVDKRINDLLHIVHDEHFIAIRRPTLGENHDKSDRLHLGRAIQFKAVLWRIAIP